MFFKRLFGRATESRDAIDPDQLIETALNSPDSAARRDACHALTDLQALRRIARDDAIIGIRELASARYRKLLCGVDPQSPSPTLEERLVELAKVEDQAMLAQLAVQATDAELRRIAITRLESQEVLAGCAVNDMLAANRLAAAEHLRDKAALEQVARGVAKRDKRVYRLTRERLKEINDRAERPRFVRAQTEALCEKLERLGRFGNWVQDHALLGHIEQQWADLQAEADAGIRARYLKLRQTFVDAYNDYAEQHAAELAEAQALADAAERRGELTKEMGGLATLTDLAELARRQSEIEQAWEQIEPAADNATARAYREALAATGAHRSRLEEAVHRARAEAALLADAKALLERGGELDRKGVNALRQRYERIAPNASTGTPTNDRLSPCAAALQQLQQRLDKHRDQVARKLAALPERLSELDQHFEQGQLKKAEPLYQSITATLAQARACGLPARDLVPAETHLKQIAPQLHELQRWRRWGTDTKRDELCSQIEALADDSEHALEPMANRLRELRDAWRELDRGSAPANDALWQRFQAAAERVHQRCRPFLDARAKIRAANSEQRRVLCEHLETFLAQADWERMDWKKAARAEREMRQAWSALGPIEGKQQKPLEGRFRKLMRRLDKALDAQRQQNYALKQDLIERMRVLVEEPDLHRAIDAAKDLQQRWQTTVPGRQRDENALWKSFRGASDAVFARRAEQQQARESEMREHQAAREAICDELSAVVSENNIEVDPDRLRADLRALETRWHETEGLALPRQVVQALQRRWNDAIDAADRRLKSLEETARWAAVARLEQRAAFCDDAAKRLVASADNADVDTLRDQWTALPAIDDRDLAERLDNSFEQIIGAASNAEARARLAQQMTDNAKRRIDLCLHLEITAGADSPQELRQQRMELQVSRLRGHMGEGDADPLADASTLLREWYLCTPANAVEGLEARFARAKQALIGAN